MDRGTCVINFQMFFLMQTINQGLQAAANIALDLDERTMPKGPLFPRFVFLSGSIFFIKHLPHIQETKATGSSRRRATDRHTMTLLGLEHFLVWLAGYTPL